MELAPLRQAERLEKPLTLPELADRARAVAARHRDVPSVPLGDTRVRLDGSWMFAGEVARLSRHALGQLCSRLQMPDGGSVPAAYLARCPAPLAAAHLNHWLSRPEREGQQVFVRTTTRSHDKTRWVRAVLSERYAAADHCLLLDTLQEVAPEHGLRVQAWSLDDEQFTLRLLLDADHPTSLHDPFRVGLTVTNSEVGLGRVSVSALITRLVCSNGLVVRFADLGGVHRKHVGRAGASLRDVVAAGVPKVLEQADRAARMFAGLRERKVPLPVEKYLDTTAERVGLPLAARRQLADALEGDTLYDVVNAVTFVAQRLPVAERLRVETEASALLEGA